MLVLELHDVRVVQLGGGELLLAVVYVLEGVAVELHDVHNPAQALFILIGRLNSQLHLVINALLYIRLQLPLNDVLLLFDSSYGAHEHFGLLLGKDQFGAEPRQVLGRLNVEGAREHQARRQQMFAHALGVSS